MSLIVHVSQLPLDYFPDSLGAMSEEQGRFYQDIKKLERTHQEN